MYGMSSIFQPKMKIKSVSRVGKSINIFCITEKNDKFLRGLENEFFSSSQRADDFIPQNNCLYIARIENKFERFKVQFNDEIEQMSYGLILDSGTSTTVPFYELRPIASSSVFNDPEAFSNEYFLAGIQFTDLCTQTQLANCLVEIQRFFDEHSETSVDLRVVCECEYGTFVNIYINNEIFLNCVQHKALVLKSCIRSVAIGEQIKMIADYAEFKKMRQQQMRPIARNLKPAAPPKFSTKATTPQEGEEESLGNFKSNVIAHHTVHKIRISHFEKGVNLFYVQLESMDANLQALSSKIQGIQLRNLSKRPSSLGMACLARYNKKVYRVAVAKSNANTQNLSYLCHFVDFGFSSYVKFDDLLYIPEDCIEIPPFAIPFCLALKDTKFQASYQEINFYFQQICENRLLTLKCVPLDGPPVCQYCELFENNTNIVGALKNFNPQSQHYPAQNVLNSSKPVNVKVCYITSVQEFFVQIQDQTQLLNYDINYYDLERLMPKAPQLSQLKVGQCCGVCIDTEWFRGQIIGVFNSRGSASVLIVDFGTVEEIPAKSIRLLTPKFIEQPPFAYRCCLKGFENGDVSENINTQFDIFCNDGQGERRIFKMLIDSFNDNRGYIVDLEDESVRPPANVNKILLKNSRPLAETITLENAKKRQSQQKKETVVVNTTKEAAVPKEVTATNETTKEPKGAERNRNSSQRGRGAAKGNSRRSTPSDENDNRRQRTHFDKQQNGNSKESADTFFKSPKEAAGLSSSEKKGAKLKPSSSNSSFEINFTNRSTPDSSPEKKNSRKSKSPKASPEKKQQKEQKSPLKREKSTVDKSIPKKVIKIGWISTFNSINDAYVHFEEHVDGLEKLMNEMFEFFQAPQSSARQLTKIHEGLICAMQSRDTNWYRGKIMQFKGETCRLLNLEYGNVEILHKSCLRELDAQFSKVPSLITRAYFGIKATEKSESKLLSELQASLTEGLIELNFEVVKKFKDGSILEVIDAESKENFFDKLVARKLAVRINDNELERILKEKSEICEDFKEINLSPATTKLAESVTSTEGEEPKQPQQEEVKPKSRISGKITALTSPNDFYLFSVEDVENFKIMQDDIQILAPALSPLLDFECSTLCLAQQPFDNLWYRAKIIDSDETIITVVCVDNGKTFSIDNKIFLKVLPEQLQRKIFFGISSSLALSIEHTCEESATQFMLPFVDTAIEFEIVLCTRDKTYVEVYVDEEKKIGDQLIEKELAKRLEFFHSGSAFTSHINSLDDFYIQLEDDQLKLDAIGSILDRANGKFEKITDPRVGDIVAAKFSDDECWYRAVIEEIGDNGKFDVKFIDFGNLSETKEIGVLDKSITELPRLSKHCRLSKPKNLINFSEAAEKKFQEISSNGATILQVNVVKPGEVTEVEVFCDGKNIIDILTPLCSIHNDNNDDF